MPSQPAKEQLRSLPAMSAILDAFADPSRSDPLAPERITLYTTLPRPMLRESISGFLDECRSKIREGAVTDAASLTLPLLMPDIIHHVALVSRPHFRRVLNGTGVVIHTNLGRSLLSQEAVDAVTEAALFYSNLEFDLETGVRGSRYSHIEALVCRLTGAERALVVNNNAAAVLLVLDTLCKGREVVVSRGELVEIGGSFRIPEVMEKSGCILKEVGATNRTHYVDYEHALTENTAAIMKVHASNFRIIGFTSEVEREALAKLATKCSIPFIEDLGSGTLFDFAGAGLPQLAFEPTAARVLAKGVDVVTFSGDKILGGPQAGIIAGKAEYIDRIKKNPLNRALRIDKMTLAALEATFRLYIDPEMAKERIPTLRMICAPIERLRAKANRLASLARKKLAGEDLDIAVQPGNSRTGGGAFPEHDLPTFLVRLKSPSLSSDKLRIALLATDPPMVARIEHDALCLDPRTLTDRELPVAVDAIRQAIDSVTIRNPEGI